MMESMKDRKLAYVISESTALEYVQKRELESAVLSYILGGSHAKTSNLIRVWSAINEYDAGKYCLEWLLSDDCPTPMRDVVHDMERLGIEIRKPFITEGK